MATQRGIRDFFAPRSTQKIVPQVEPPTAPQDAQDASNRRKTMSPSEDVPVSSQLSSQPSSSQPPRKFVVKSSDTEDSDSDSDDSLLDMSELLRKTAPTSSSQNENASRPKIFPKPTVKPGTSPVRNADIEAQLKALRASVKQEKEEVAKSDHWDKKLEAANAESKQLEVEGSVGIRNSVSSNTDVLKSVIKERNEDEVQDILQALKRTEATKTRTFWHFFDFKATEQPQDFPAASLKGRWKLALSTPEERKSTFLSGLAMELVEIDQDSSLPDEIFLWMLHQLCSEDNFELRQAYHDVILASAAQIQALVRADVIRGMFVRLGASQEALNNQNTARHNGNNAKYHSKNWSMLIAVVGLLGEVAEHLSNETQEASFCLLCRLCMDAVVFRSICLLSAVQKSLSRFCVCFEENEWPESRNRMCVQLFSCSKSSSLQLQMLRCLPATRPRIHDIRQRLALAFFFRDGYYTTQSPHAVLDLSKMTRELTKSRFKTSDDTDYYDLAAEISLLDMAIDNGKSEYLDTTNADEEMEFNEQIDRLEAQIKTIWSGINDKGASFISRLEAKEVIETVRNRITNAVRTRAKPKQSIFEKEERQQKEMEQQASFMRGYLWRQ